MRGELDKRELIEANLPKPFPFEEESSETTCSTDALADAAAAAAAAAAATKAAVAAALNVCQTPQAFRVLSRRTL